MITKRAAIVVLVGALGIVGSGCIPDRNGSITGCYKKSGGQLRVVDADAGGQCAADETKLPWNQKGPQGVPGSDASAARHDELIWSTWYLSACRHDGSWEYLGTGCTGNATTDRAEAVASAKAIDPADWPSGATFRLETVVRVTATHTQCTRLYNTTVDAVVANSEACFTGPSTGALRAKLMSGPLSLGGANDQYVIQVRVDTVDANFYHAGLLIDWGAPASS